MELFDKTNTTIISTSLLLILVRCGTQLHDTDILFSTRKETWHLLSKIILTLNNIRKEKIQRVQPVSYTHLDVYKRQL